jgi:hypothetical protein
MIKYTEVESYDIASLVDELNAAIGPKGEAWDWGFTHKTQIEVKTVDNDDEATAAAVIEAHISTAGELARVQAAVIHKVNVDAGLRRKMVASPGEGIDAVYTEKRDEARALQSDSNPDQVDYPFLAAEVGIDIYPPTQQPTANIGEVAGIVLGIAVVWKKYVSEIEKIRRTANKDINNAGAASEVQAIVDKIVWPPAPVE